MRQSVFKSQSTPPRFDGAAIPVLLMRCVGGGVVVVVVGAQNANARLASADAVLQICVNLKVGKWNVEKTLHAAYNRAALL